MITACKKDEIMVRSTLLCPSAHSWPPVENLTSNVNCDDLATFCWQMIEHRYLSNFLVWVLFAEAYSFQNLQSDWKIVHVWYRNFSQSNFFRELKIRFFHEISTFPDLIRDEFQMTILCQKNENTLFRMKLNCS